MKKLALLFSFLFITIFSYQAITQATAPSYLGVCFLSQNEWEEKISDLTPVETGVIGHLVLFESGNLFYDASTACHFITVGENNTGNFETKAGIELYWISEFNEASATAMIANDEAFPLLAIYNGSYEIISLKISTLPLVSFSVADNAQTITIANPDDTQAGRYTTTTYLTEYHVRGATSSIFPKTPYKVSLIDDDGDRLSASLFGMRSDDDWNFNAVYGDTTRIREAATLDLMQQMADTNEDANIHPQDGQFCELFINDVYYGIYQVLERMDTQQTEIDESTDYLYKIAQYLTSDKINDTLHDREDDSADPKLKSYPEGTEDTRYEPLLDYYAFLNGETTETGVSLSKSTLDEIATVIDIDNLIELSIANTVFNLTDNSGKNFMLIFEEQEDGSMLASREYFDFNYSFGDVYISKDIESETFALTTSASASDISTDDIFRLFEDTACYDELVALYQARYTKLRQDVLSEENILSVLDSYYTTLDNSGAYIRDTAHWSMPNKDTAAAYAELTSYITAHLSATDEYVAGLL